LPFLQSPRELAFPSDDFLQIWPSSRDFVCAAAPPNPLAAHVNTPAGVRLKPFAEHTAEDHGMCVSESEVA
jgi:hypothetical protein